MYMQVRNKTDFNSVKSFLKEKNIFFNTTETVSNFILNVSDNALERTHVDYLMEELNAEKIFLDNGYLSTKAFKDKTHIKVGNVTFGEDKPVFISGPCCIESQEQLIKTAVEVKKSGAHVLRGGAYKPRTSPYDFQGIGKEGLKILFEAKKITGLPIISELMDIDSLDSFIEYVDIIQIGARNMQNFPLLKTLGKIQKPILLKRGLSSTVKELLLCAEYIILQGNEQVMLCERGIRTFETYTRNTMDISAITLLKELSHLPVIADPSHATGVRNLIKPMTYASIAAGADGVMIESHIKPDTALCDGKQSIYPNELKSIIEKSNQIRSVIR
ncbi:3-deoxy-7-phosphoheptulonate synthase [Tepidibacter hydrothermalis]|uniref:3-deoxy-7-phosphoheptulonate synthase n=1 Tax=Tepidibacter hydrothermalis TaxID=3036126 RepID=A0ABY8EFW2_9FIRM|nr:3-deoxy-7-phosphoheptulonate synthase [Tepidibacter hydrothermalis]WFD11841.1 3-deoxy-7-phosphoheptulonate synthase [Tepidibacter hydrothermalis]